MRFFPIITAILVVIVLYSLVFERDRIFALVGNEEAAEVAEAATAPISDAPRTAADSIASSERQVSVVVMRSTAREIEGALIVRGRTEASRQVEVRAETTGRVISDPILAGSVIQAGQDMCVIEPGTREVSLAEAEARLVEARSRIPEAQARLPEAEAGVASARASVSEANARLAEAEINFNAAERLSEDGFASETRVKSATAALEAARAGVESANSRLQASLSGITSAEAGVESAASAVQSAEAAVAAAKKEIERLTITAPFGGILENDTAELGSLLQAGSICATIIQMDPLKLVGFIPETDVGRVAVGARAGARLASGQEVFGEVTFLSRSADEQTRTFRVEIRVPNPDGMIRDGQTADILIEAPGDIAHLLPQSAATLNDDGALGVRLMTDDNRAEWAAIQILRDTVDGVWVAGLPEQANIIVVGQEFVTDGVSVKPTFREDDQ